MDVGNQDDTRQSGLWNWVEGVDMPVHDCKYDVLWEANGATPPCKRPVGDPYYEPPSVTR